MPRGDKTGPLGRGPKTGRAFGPCNQAQDSTSNSSFFNRPFGRGLRRLLGLSRGRRG